MKTQNTSYKNSLPLQFYAFRGLLLGGLIFLLLIRVHYFYSLIYFFFAFLFSLNKDNYIIEVSNESFNLILPSFYGNKFTDTQTYFFEDINSFEFEKGFYDGKAAILGETARIILPMKFTPIGALFAYKNPTISFTQKNGERISIKFSYNQDSLLKAIELINKKVNLNKKARN